METKEIHALSLFVMSDLRKVKQKATISGIRKPKLGRKNIDLDFWLVHCQDRSTFRNPEKLEKAFRMADSPPSSLSGPTPNKPSNETLPS